jgi:5-methylcytosine-specific restriction endonuclease McrA
MSSPSKSLPWFRVYGELLSDRKISRICAITKQPKVIVVGIWTTLLALASQSPERGRLLISDGLPLTLEEIAFETGLDNEECQRLIDAFISHNMICSEGDCFVIVHWDDRQFGRDDSKERVRKYREKREALGLTVAPRYDSAAILERDEKQCVYCGSNRNLCVDHIYPIEQGGTDHTNNLAAACKACSGGKAGRTPEQAGYKFVSLEAQTRFENYLDTVMDIRKNVTVTGNVGVTSVTPLESESDSESTTTKAADQETFLRREIVSIWENNINVGGPGSILVNMIVDVLDDIPGDTELKLKWFTEAVGRAKGAGVNNWRYVRAILLAWIEKGEIDDKPPEEESAQPRRGKKQYQRQEKSPLPPSPDLPPPKPPPAWVEVWEKISGDLAAQIPREILSLCQARPNKNGTFTIAVPEAFKEQIDNRPKLRELILRAVQHHKSGTHKLEVVTL